MMPIRPKNELTQSGTYRTFGYLRAPLKVLILPPITRLESRGTRRMHGMKPAWRSLVAGVIIAAAQSASAAGNCDITFRVVSAADTSLLAVTVMVDYADAAGEFEGVAAEVNCESLVPVGAAGFVDNDIDRFFSLAIAGTQGTLSVPHDLVRCVFLPTAGEPTTGDFDVSVTAAFGSTGMPVAATVQVSDITCEGTSQTTTTTMTTSSTLPPPMPACGDPNGNGVAATDALFVLGAALGLQVCGTCFCDVDDSAAITSSDALRVLQFAVGLMVLLNCPLCGG